VFVYSAQFLNNTQIAQILGLLFSTVKAMHYVDKKGVDTFWAIFLTHSSVFDVMITIFCEFGQFSAKKLAFLSKTNGMIKLLRNLALF
jgi:hypothetical protein